MGTSFDFINTRQAPQPSAQMNFNQMRQIQQIPVQAPQAPTVEIGGFHFSVRPDDPTDNSFALMSGPKIETAVSNKSKKPVRKKKENTSLTTTNNSISTIEENSTLNTYTETAYMLKDAMMQIDAVASEIKQELDSVRASRTMRNRSNIIVGLAGNISDLVQAKISAVRELNNCITKSNDLDYKREKDRRDAAGAQNDDQAIMAMYQAFIQNPNTSPMTATNPAANLGPSMIQASTAGSGIITATTSSNTTQDKVDAGFMNYVANLTPEQNAMLYEKNPDIKQVVVFDAATNNKWFQVMNVRTGQVIPNAPVHDPMFMEDTTIDKKNRLAKNVNLGETYPLIILNENLAHY